MLVQDKIPSNSQMKLLPKQPQGRVLLCDKTTTRGAFFSLFPSTTAASDPSMIIIFIHNYHFLLAFSNCRHKEDGAIVRRCLTTGEANYKGRSNKCALCGVSEAHTYKSAHTGNRKKVLFIFFTHYLSLLHLQNNIPEALLSAVLGDLVVEEGGGWGRERRLETLQQAARAITLTHFVLRDARCAAAPPCDQRKAYVALPLPPAAEPRATH